MANKAKSIAPQLLDLVINCVYPFQTPFEKGIEFKEISESNYTLVLDFLWDKIVRHISENRDDADIVYEKLKRNLINPPDDFEQFDEDKNRLVLSPKTLKSTFIKGQCSAKTMGFFEALEIVIQTEEAAKKDLRRVSGYYNTYNLHNTKSGKFQISNLHIALEGESYLIYIGKRYPHRYQRRKPVQVEIINKDKLLITYKEEDFRLIFYAYIGKENAPALIQAIFLYNNTDGQTIASQCLLHRIESPDNFADPRREQSDIPLSNEQGKTTLSIDQQKAIKKYLFNKAHFNKPVFNNGGLKFDFDDLRLEPAPAKQTALFYQVTKTLCGYYRIYYNERYMTAKGLGNQLKRNHYYSTVGEGILQIYEDDNTGVLRCKMTNRKNKSGETVTYKGYVQNDMLNDQAYLILNMYANNNTRFINLILTKAGGDYLLGSHNIMYEPALELGTGPVVVMRDDTLSESAQPNTLSPCPKKDDSTLDCIINYISQNREGLNVPITRFSDLDKYKNLRIEGIYKMYSYGKGGIRRSGLKINKSGFVEHIGHAASERTIAYGYVEIVGAIVYITLRDVATGRLGFLILRVAESEPHIDTENKHRSTIYVGTFCGVTRRNEQHPLASRIVVQYTNIDMAEDLNDIAQARMFKGDEVKDESHIPTAICNALLSKEESFVGFLKRRTTILDLDDLQKFNDESSDAAEAMRQRAVYFVLKNEYEKALELLGKIRYFPDAAMYMEQFEKDLKEMNVNNDFLKNARYKKFKDSLFPENKVL